MAHAERDPLSALVDLLADRVAHRVEQLLAAKGRAATDPAWGKVSQATLPPWIHPKAYVEACRAGRVVGARLWRRQWITERVAVEAWWIAESREPSALGSGVRTDGESDAEILAAAGLTPRGAP